MTGPPTGPPSGPTGSTSTSAASPPAVPTNPRRLTTIDYETLDRRYTIAVNLECWELMAMHSIANNESIPRLRLKMLKAFAGLPTDDAGTDGPFRRRGWAAPAARRD
ncbi:hypothetical protein BZA05DRAFT_390023 [Tricharina praecox]|uniref:uncharacterized protein n=1 Tax=Tricharina praecox TaxID=43433 RepID=UPI00221F161C|nr:uncharacterized protein BZA05DRAFT_390023 [Tricharina praecox]KAI5855909.1 hypothetical protein BZA05DRAFT_390023 [Tricharina praecox]